MTVESGRKGHLYRARREPLDRWGHGVTSYECAKAYGRVLWGLWGFELGAKVKGG